jgi:hypothetical protein
MNKILFTVLIAAVSYNAYSQNKNCETDKAAIINFLTKYCSYHDANPTHQEEADEVNAFVKKIFENKYSADRIPNLITQSLQLFYDNSLGVFEDGTDVRRMVTRRSMCSMALAFLADEYRYPAFLADAYHSVKQIDIMQDKWLLIINMIDLYKELGCENANLEYLISSFEDDLKKKEKNIEDKILISEYKKILSDLKSKLQ